MVHVNDAQMYEGPPCKMCTDGMFVGTCTHRPRMEPPKLPEIPPSMSGELTDMLEAVRQLSLPRELKDIIIAARRFCQEHRNVEKNPEKLLAAKTAEACTRVGNECTESMKVYQEALTGLEEASKYFMVFCTSRAAELREADQNDLRIAFAAARFILAQCEFDLIPSSLKYRSRGPIGPEGKRYFQLRQELVDIVEMV